MAKLFRLVRVIKVAKLLKWIIRDQGKNSNNNEDDLGLDEGIDMKMSVVGKKMTERITKKGNVFRTFHLKLYFRSNIHLTVSNPAFGSK